MNGKEKYIKDRQHTNSEDKKVTQKNRTCWHCKLHGKNILDKYGCCKRCGTNLIKYPTYDSHPYPVEILASARGDSKLDAEVLGSRERFTVPEDSGQGDW